MNYDYTQFIFKLQNCDMIKRHNWTVNFLILSRIVMLNLATGVAREINIKNKLKLSNLIEHIKVG